MLTPVRASRTTSLRLLAIGAVAATIAAACGSSGSGVTATRSESGNGVVTVTTDASVTTIGGETTTPDTVTEDTSGPLTPPTAESIPVSVEQIIDFGDAKPPQEYDAYMNAAFVDITQFWTENFPVYSGGTFEPVSGIYAHYPDRTPLPESCQGPVAYEEVYGNAFWTDCGDIIVYDDDFLLPELVTKLGVAAVAVVAAHEYGHAIQGRAGVFDIPGLRTIDTEQQADCFAGAWSAHVARGESPLLSFGDPEIKAGLVAMIEVRDPPGTDSANDPSGHGNAFDRVGAFQEGFVGGIDRCKTFPEDPPRRVDLVFTTQEEVDTGGNLPYDQIVDALPKALDTFWVPTLTNSGISFTPPTYVPYPHDGPFPACTTGDQTGFQNNAVYCSDSNTIAYDDEYVQALYGLYGDMAFAYPIMDAYSDAVQTALGSGLTGEPRVLLNDCLGGAWVIDIVPASIDADGFPVATNPDQEILLSAGDLDEVVQTAVLEGDTAGDMDVVGTAFEKIDAFRDGVLDGLAGCQARLG